MFKRFLRRVRRYFLPSLFVLGLAGLACAQSLDLSGITSQAQAFVPFAKLIGAVVCVIGLIFAALAIRGRNVAEGIVGVVVMILGMFIIAKAEAWVSAITGVSV